MDAFLKLLHEFPAAWAIIGAAATAIGTTIFYVTLGKRLSPIYGNAIENLSRANKEQISANAETQRLHKEHYDTEITYLKQTIAKLENERETYKKSSHENANTAQALKLTIAELESRPNVDQVYKGQQKFFTDMSKYMEEQTGTLRAIHDSIIKHDQGIEARTATVVEQVFERLNGNK